MSNRDVGAPVRQLCGYGRVTETLHLLPYLHTELGPKGSLPQSASRSVKAQFASPTIPGIVCGLLKFPFSCKFSSQM